MVDVRRSHDRRAHATDPQTADPGSSQGAATPTPRPRYLILGTAGHIDHGKTSLVRALTGTDTDRLPEERRRGMTIELGFAELSLPGVHFGIVDVPGHERFVRTMVAGATGIDMALIVVAGDDSVMPQTIEHVDVLKLMGIERAVVAITKADLVDETMLQLVEEDVRDLLAGTALATSPIVRVSSATGLGLDDLRTQLAGQAERIAVRAARSPFRMAVDRVFTVQGRGTVVTGSVMRGVVRTGDTLEILPSGLPCRVRDMQSHGRARDAISLGQRAALNLIGVDRGAISRGDELATRHYIAPSHRVDALFERLAHGNAPLKPFSAVRVSMGTREVIARVVTLDGQPIKPGSSSYVQLRSREPILAAHGQRFIARTENDSRTIGGGTVLRPQAGRWSADRDAERASLRRLEHGDPTERLTQVMIESGFAAVSDLRLAARTGIEPDLIPSMLDSLARQGRWHILDGADRPIVPAVIDRLFSRADRWLDRYHTSHADEPGCHVDAFTGWLERKSAAGLGRPLLGRYLELGRAKVRGDFVCLPGFSPDMSAQDERIYSAMVEAVRAAGFQPPSLDQLGAMLGADKNRLRRLVKVAVSYGELVQISATLYLAAADETRLRDLVAGAIRDNSGATVSDIRRRLDSTRKYVVPFLEYLDRCGFTLRRGDRRVLAGEPTP